MNILVITAMFPPIRTGTSFYSKNLAQALFERGHRVLVLTLTNREAAEDTCTFEVRRLSAFHFPLKFFRHFRLSSPLLWNWAEVRRIGTSFKPNVILLVNQYLDIAFLAVYLSKVLAVPLFCSVGTQLQSTDPFRDRILNILDRLICGKIVFRSCRKIISWDNQIHQYLKDVHSTEVVNKSVVIPYGINGRMEDFLSYEHDYRLKNQIVGVGAVIKQRDFLFLIRLLKELEKQFPALTVKIIGHVYYDAPVRLARDLGLESKVVFTGELPHDEVVNEVTKSDLCWGVATGKYTGVGTANIENMLLGVPVVSNISSDVFGEPMLFDGQQFVYTDLVDLDRTVHRVGNLLVSQDLRKAVGQGGREFVKHYLGWEKIAKSMESLFLEAN